MAELVECIAFLDSAGTNSASLEDIILFCVFAAFGVTKMERKATSCRVLSGVDREIEMSGD